MKNNEYFDIFNEDGNVSHVELRINSPKFGLKIVLIDEEDFELVSKYTWWLNYQKEKDQFNIMSEISKGGVRTVLRIHRIILNITDSKQVIDHENRNRFDNRKFNIRKVSGSVNSLNTKISKNNVSGRAGVWFEEAGKKTGPRWLAKGTKDGKIVKRSFALSKYGEKARELACKAREEFENKFNVLSEKGI